MLTDIPMLTPDEPLIHYGRYWDTRGYVFCVHALKNDRWSGWCVSAPESGPPRKFGRGGTALDGGTSLTRLAFLPRKMQLPGETLMDSLNRLALAGKYPPT